ncbi:MaoC family dehydratase [Pseudoduganella namucuonensis]|uniref:Acyl dehydratase n=1 Tax=Pseudoduganella namucuonensis TaxID=1035707 RepID=A0A1I7LSG1_9BURK|nr:MaoC family dehydratase [Pseudoduganella namucuonensis]SFV12568.1 Acyl dehydratase [Pseudoduganella namucuonensis]
MAYLHYWEDFPVGSVRDFAPRTLEREDVLDFARRYDPQPFHIDDGAARASQFGGLIASGWHVCAFAMRMLCDGDLLATAGMGSPGVETIRWRAPARPGDHLRLRSTVMQARLLKSRPGVGLLLTRWEMHNQRDELVMTMEGYGMVACRGAHAD